MFSPADYEDVARFFEAHPELAPTPLLHLPALAATLGLGDLLVKDESARFGLNAFKIVGVAYAVDRLLRDRRVETLVCATEGNHGRAVARAARQRGLRALVYIRDSAEPWRVDALRREGAEVVLVAGTYDDAVRRMAADTGRMSRAAIVSDTSWAGYEAVPRAIMAGYTWIMREAAMQWNAAPPDVVAIQAGVGGLAGAVAGWLLDRWPGPRRPCLLCAEPERAACVRASLVAGRPVPVVPGDTIAAGLRCGEMSPIAFAPLAAAVADCVSVDDAALREAMDRLAHPTGDDPVVHAGPSGACGLAALRAWMQRPEWAGARERARVAAGSRALVVVTEGPSTTPPSAPR
jgi:diaminopropionate ammonia-lyase